MTESLPQFKVSLDSMPQWFLNQRVRRGILLGFLLILVTVPLVLLIVADHFRLNPDTLASSYTLFMAGMGSQGVLYFIDAVYLIWLILIFRKTLGVRLKAVSSNMDVNQDKDGFNFLVFTFTKLMQSIRSSIVVCCIFGAYFFILAFYGDFFNNTVASQVVFTVVMVLYEMIMIHLHVLYLV